MRYYFPLFLFLGGIFLGAVYFDLTVLAKDRLQKAQSDQLDLSYQQQKQGSDLVQDAAKRFYETELPARAFLAQWRHSADDAVLITTISGWISDRAAALDILMDPGAGQLNQEYSFGSEKIPVFSYPVTLTASDWTKVMDFLADFEQHFPIARMDNITIQSDSSVVLTIGPVFPQFSFSEPIRATNYEDLFTQQRAKLAPAPVH